MDMTFTPEEIQFQCDLDVSYELIEGGSNYNSPNGGTHEG